MLPQRHPPFFPPDTNFTAATFILRRSWGPAQPHCRICSVGKELFPPLRPRGGVGGGRQGRWGLGAAGQHHGPPHNHAGKAAEGAHALCTVETRLRGQSHQMPRSSWQPEASLASRLNPGACKASAKAPLTSGVEQALDTNWPFLWWGFPLPFPHKCSEALSLRPANPGFPPAVETRPCRRPGMESGAAGELGRPERPGARLPGTRLVQKEQEGALASLHGRGPSAVHLKTSPACALTPKPQLQLQLCGVRKPDSSREAKRVPNTSSQLKIVRNWGMEV